MWVQVQFHEPTLVFPTCRCAIDYHKGAGYKTSPTNKALVRVRKTKQREPTRDNTYALYGNRRACGLLRIYHT